MQCPTREQKKSKKSLTDAVLLGDVLDRAGGVRAHGEETNEGSAVVALLPHASHVEQDRLYVARTHRVCNVLARLRRYAVLTERSAKHPASNQ